MVKTVNKGFEEFLYRLTPSESETAAAKKHRASIESCLKTNFGMTKFFRTGSFGNAMSIYGHSDVDYFAVIPRKNLTQNSQVTLNKIRKALLNRFSLTDIQVRTPAVCVCFDGDEEHTEIVPAKYLPRASKHCGFDIYDIPNRDGTWMRSSPVKHNAWITQIDEKLSSKVKPLIRFVKAWKYLQNAPINSFYLELRVTKYASKKKTINYSRDIHQFFKQLLDCNLATIQDPIGVSGFVEPCTESQKEKALSKLNTAFKRANNAIIDEQTEKINNAFYWWNMFYNQNFPKYY